jgi:hypothetical protein
VLAGNQGFNLAEIATYPAAYGLNHPLVLTVGASGVQDEWVEYASWDAVAVHISAPGTTILSTWPGGFVEYSSGTGGAEEHPTSCHCNAGVCPSHMTPACALTPATRRHLNGCALC